MLGHNGGCEANKTRAKHIPSSTIQIVKSPPISPLFFHSQRHSALYKRICQNLLTQRFEWSKVCLQNVHDNQNSMTTTLADTILVINNSDAYHMEAQMKKDDSIVFRVFSYGAGYADQTKEILQDEEGCQVYRIHFPEPCVIYLSNVPKSVPDTYSLQVGFGHTQNITYNVPVTKLTSCSVKEINDRKMIILIPFYILKLREKLRNKKARTPENIASLKSLIKTDIMGSIDKNVELGNITAEDGAQLYRLLRCFILAYIPSLKRPRRLRIWWNSRLLHLWMFFRKRKPGWKNVWLRWIRRLPTKTRSSPTRTTSLPN